MSEESYYSGIITGVFLNRNSLLLVKSPKMQLNPWLRKAILKLKGTLRKLVLKFLDMLGKSIGNTMKERIRKDVRYQE